MATNFRSTIFYINSCLQRSRWILKCNLCHWTINIKISEKHVPLSVQWLIKKMSVRLILIYFTILLKTMWSQHNNLIGSKATSFENLRIAGTVLNVRRASMIYLPCMSNISRKFCLRKCASMLFTVFFSWMRNPRQHPQIF